MMKKNTLKDSVNEKLQEHALSGSQMLTLKALQQRQDTSDNGKTQNRGRCHTVGFGLAASLAIVLSLIWLLQPQSVTLLPVEEIALEVAGNHLSQKPLEIESSTLPPIRDYFNKLDFMPINSEYLADKGLVLLGGRYCSLQGINAAQLRFSPAGENSSQTLYQVGYDPATFESLPKYDLGETPVTTYAKGVKVTIWVEKGLVFALTGN